MLNSEFLSPLPISSTPSSDPIIRRAARLLSMVHELHKAGYQRLRICAGHSLDGSEWRCHLVPSINMYGDGWTPLSLDRVPLYSSTQEKFYFDWDDAINDNARILAAKFLERFPDTARASIGQDWEYAGWFTSILGMAENGDLPAFYGGYNYENKKSPTPFPPSNLELNSKPFNGEGYSDIPHENLRLIDLPLRDADYELLCPFCLTFEGYRTAELLGIVCETIAEDIERLGLQNASMEGLRITAFIRQRAIKWSSNWPIHEPWLKSIRDVIEEVRRRLSVDA